MNCPLCEEICRCNPEPSSALPDVPHADVTAAVAEAVPGVEDPAWRDELSARLNRFRARRKMPPPRYPSLVLRFDSGATGHPADPRTEASDLFETVSNQALALDPMANFPPQATGRDEHCTAADQAGLATDRFVASAPSAQSQTIAGSQVPGADTVTTKITGVVAKAKIIEFPRFAWAPPAPPPDQLAEPVMERPRILDVPEVAPPPPALGGITIEPAQRQENEKRPGIDLPLQSASLGRRALAGLVDWLVVALASTLSGVIFWKIAEVRPPTAQMLGLAIAVPGLFWALYQYLLIVYTGRTVGLLVAGLEIVRFNGTATNRALRRWRVLGSYLSAASLGMGYAWVLLDEDSLCWHDRITHTHIAPRK
jgi:uncharacterized RDD family membrane protein YckC